MFKKVLFTTIGFLSLCLLLSSQSFSQGDKIVQVAIEALKTQGRLPKGTEIRFVEKKESPIPGFYSVKVFVLAQTREIPVVIYVDSAGEKIILGNLIIKGENVTLKEAGEPKPRKFDAGQLEIEKSPFRGPAVAKMTIVEFSNFQCPHCAKLSKQIKDLLEKYPQDIKYVFKHFPLQAQGKAFELSEMIAATQEVGKESFWIIHDFFFSDEGQALVNLEREPLKRKIGEILKARGYDEKAFQMALEMGKGKKRVEDDLALGNKIGVNATPTLIINGDFVGSTLTDKMVAQYLGK